MIICSLKLLGDLSSMVLTQVKGCVLLDLNSGDFGKSCDLRRLKVK